MVRYIPLPIFTEVLKLDANRSDIGKTAKVLFHLRNILNEAKKAYHAPPPEAHEAYVKVRDWWMSDEQGYIVDKEKERIMRNTFREALDKAGINFDTVWVSLLKAAPDMGDQVSARSWTGARVIDGKGRTGTPTWAERWVIECAMHKDADVDGTLRPWLSKYLENIKPLKKERDNTRTQKDLSCKNTQEDRSTMGPFPGLTRSLRQLECHSRVVLGTMAWDAKSARDVEIVEEDRVDQNRQIFHVLHEYVRLGMNVVDFVRRFRNTVGTWREHNYRAAVDHMTSELLWMLEDPNYSEQIPEQPPVDHVVPLRVRNILADMNMEGNIGFLTHHVMPELMAAVETNEELGMAMYRWLVNAATHPSVDEDGTFEQAIAQICEIPTNSPPNFRPLGMRFQMGELFEENADYQMVELMPSELYEGVAVEAYGPLIHVGDFSKRFNIDESADDAICAICQYGISESESQCVKLNACSDVFHHTCLLDLVNRPHTYGDMTRCPCCRVPICARREIRVLPLGVRAG
ncbi:hypothetical protein BDV95DRAFT_572294 [Massariosphaeria phaeospora]|uniref:RING-type domain-containing protein n=1 Tax=Massariosphaeria phaeospora TaxID=100035 RepID=A0A7C8MNZ1_9PLEO|nr:hypothetical protein BDV95DRAFT_572294 [Massariosphaeria phaeospora]